MAEPPVPPVFGKGSCDAAAAARFVGKPADPATLEAARKAAGAGVVRTLAPGRAVTMDYREDRLNLDVDRGGVIRGVRCG